ncbi:hypothetical protein [Gloeothece verrucosa]|uniref:Uncharacterized protein n=1 Tax=Gloeothece verrucosa (strain PCC 7822) TaxID=497965 RepID=E0U6H3_GLOV7|nr:hypothetical protein [Gloeothece verrucosa]ADN13616.1 hypothetical protein Cyan7822_1625 [Gloeothece verrucosa PCC 7822]
MVEFNLSGCLLGLTLLLRICDLLLVRLPRGTRVRVHYPKYAAGFMGIIQGREKGASRWLVKLQNDSFQDNPEPMILSLDLSDFQIVELPDFKPN